MKKGTAIAVITLLALATLASSAFALSFYKKEADSSMSIAANYRHAFSEVVSGAEGLDAALQKSILVTSPSMAGAVCTEIYAQAQTTGMALGVLPFSATELEKTAGFINAVGDYALALSRKAARGEDFSEEEKETLKSLSEAATKIYSSLKSIEDELGSAMLSPEEYKRSWKEYGAKEGDLITQTLADSVSAAAEEFPEIPHLIYDGPFSEHLSNASPKLLEGREEIDVSQGRKRAAGFIGMRPEQVYPTGEMKGVLPALCYGAELNGAQLNICVSKRGGEVLSLLNSRQVDRSVLTPKEALDAAKKQLERWGYSNMKESYFLIQNNIMTANFAYEQEGVVCYPDLIHVGIAMDNGSLQYFEATGYISSHTQRELPVAEVTLETAREKVPAWLSIFSEQTVIIPSPGGHELLCYEFKGLQEDGRSFIIYVNAVTGNQEKILILLEDESGALTM